MLFGMNQLLFICVCVLALGRCGAAQGSCSSRDRVEAARRALELQKSAMNYKMGSMDSGVPVEARELILQFKAAVASAVDAAMACHDTATQPEAIQAELAAALHANKPAIGQSDKSAGGNDDGFTPVAGVLGSDLTISVRKIAIPSLLQITASSSVACGDDSQLMLYEAQGTQWKRVLRWSSPFSVAKDEKFSSEIFGDFFLTRFLMQPDGTWRAVVAHGTPWCTSRFSSFGLAVLAPNSSGNGRVVWKSERDYSRAEFEPRLTVSANTFEFRDHNDEMSLNEDGFERLVVYRYRVNGDELTRIQPFGANARGFVEEWLSAPWEEALAQTETATATALQPLHKRFEERYAGDGKSSTSWEAGPVQACAGRTRFQVAFHTSQQTIVVGKPGGETKPGPTYYFQTQQVENGYRMLAAPMRPDPNCGGPDLMRRSAGQKKN